MNPDIFIDTSGYYALLIKNDNTHKKACEILLQAAKEKSRFVTTDYILDEIATLLKMRSYEYLLSELFESILNSKACRIEWMDQERFEKTKSFFLKHCDHHWSFTDCFSFIIMKELKLTDALSKDMHYREAGFRPLLLK